MPNKKEEAGGGEKTLNYSKGVPHKQVKHSTFNWKDEIVLQNRSQMPFIILTVNKAEIKVHSLLLKIGSFYFISFVDQFF